jgi:hypothetical protein
LIEKVEEHDLRGKGKNKMGEMVPTDVNSTKSMPRQEFRRAPLS